MTVGALLVGSPTGLPIHADRPDSPLVSLVRAPRSAFDRIGNDPGSSS